jgi:hypothetical protein
MKPQFAGHAVTSSGSLADEAQGNNHEDVLAADLARLRQLLERGEVEEARDWASKLESRWPGSEAVRGYARVLAPPRVSVRPGHQGASRHLERAWLREHAGQYPGRWLAILDDQLLAADPDLRTVLATVQQTPDSRRPLLHFQPELLD